jgi:uncharacterized tellurite resistance protein B-like protein
VGSVRTLGVLAAAAHDAARDARDRVVVEVHWDGRSLRVEPGGTRRIEAERRMRRTLFVFTRRAGARSRVEHALTATCCSSCGAADDGSLASFCAYCNAPRIGDDSAWLLAEVRSAGDAAALQGELRALRSGPVPPPSPHGLLAWTASVLRADGEIGARERAGFERLALSFGVPAERVAAMLAGTRAEDAAALHAADEADARAWLAALVEAALADGSLHRRERRLLRAAAARLGLAERDVDRAIGAKRSALYRDARRA